MGDERRKERRFSFEGRVWCDVDDVSRYVHFRDVSLVGAKVETLLPLDVGALTRMRWGEVDEGIEVSARVIWTAPGEEGTICVGLVFEQVDTPEPLTKFIRRRENNPTCALASSPTSTPTLKR